MSPALIFDCCSICLIDNSGLCNLWHVLESIDIFACGVSFRGWEGQEAFTLPPLKPSCPPLRASLIHTYAHRQVALPTQKFWLHPP